MLRTNIVDSGLGMRVFEVFKRGTESNQTHEVEPGDDTGRVGEGVTDVMVGDSENVDADITCDIRGNEDVGEDRRVLGAALAAICNIVNEFSPLRPVCSFSTLPTHVKLLSEGDLFSPRFSLIKAWCPGW